MHCSSTVECGVRAETQLGYDLRDNECDVVDGITTRNDGVLEADLLVSVFADVFCEEIKAPLHLFLYIKHQYWHNGIVGNVGKCSPK